jgi:hypothetical protein
MAERRVDAEGAAPALDDDDDFLPIPEGDDEEDEMIDGLDGLGELAEMELRTTTADVDDSFYQFATPQLASWFAIRELADPTEFGVHRIWDSRLGKLRDVVEGERCYLGFSCLPMGWSWARYFCHTAVSHLARYRLGIPEDAVIRERCPAPELAPGKPALGIYVENVYSIAFAVGDSLKMVASFVDEGDERSLRIHWKCQDSTEATVLGVEVCGTPTPHPPRPPPCLETFPGSSGAAGPRVCARHGDAGVDRTLHQHLSVVPSALCCSRGVLCLDDVGWHRESLTATGRARRVVDGKQSRFYV